MLRPQDRSKVPRLVETSGDVLATEKEVHSGSEFFKNEKTHSQTIHMRKKHLKGGFEDAREAA